MKQTMRKNLHRALSLFMAMVMMLSLINVTALAEGVGHEHNQDGWTCEQAPDVKEFTCTKEEHVHTDECYQGEATTELTCGLEETDGHAHTDDCYETKTELTCGLEESEGHTHTMQECYVLDCDIPTGDGEHIDADSHTHKFPGCYKLVCDIPESAGHTHTDGCYTEVRELKCGLEEAEPHTHTAECYTERNALSCTKEEHIHTDECYTVVAPGEWSCTPPAEVPEEPEIDEAAQAVIDQFSALTEEDVNGYSDAYKAARGAYLALSEEQQAQVMEILGEDVVRAILLGEAMEDQNYAEYDPTSQSFAEYLWKEREYRPAAGIDWKLDSTEIFRFVIMQGDYYDYNSETGYYDSAHAYPIYCIQAGKNFSDENYDVGNEDQGSYLSPGQQKLIGLILTYGYDQRTITYAKSDVTSQSVKDVLIPWMATQLLVWEVAPGYDGKTNETISPNGYRDLETFAWNADGEPGSTGNEFDYTKVYKALGKVNTSYQTTFKTCYDNLVTKVTQAIKTPSLREESVTWDSSNCTIVLEDTNYALFQEDTVSVTYGGETLTATYTIGDDNCTLTIVIPRNQFPDVFDSEMLKISLTRNTTCSNFFVATNSNNQNVAAKRFGSGTVSVSANVTVDVEAPDGSLTVRKTVTDLNSDTSAPRNSDDSFTIQVTLTDGAGANTEHTGLGAGSVDYAGNGTYTFSLKGDQSATIANIPLGVQYSVSETVMPDGYTGHISGGDNGNGTGSVVLGDTDTVTVTNDYWKPSHTSVTVQKTWTDMPADDQLTPSSVTVELWQKIGAIESRYATVELTKAQGWSYTWDNLPHYAKIDQSEPYTYYVKETEVKYASPNVTARAAGENFPGLYIVEGTTEAVDNSGKEILGGWMSAFNGFTINNTWITPKTLGETAFTIHKEDAANHVDLSDAVFTLHKDGEADRTFTTDSNGNAVVVGLSEGTYTLEETTAPEGYDRDTTIWTVTVRKDSLAHVEIESTGSTPNLNNTWNWKPSIESTSWKPGTTSSTSDGLTSAGTLTVTNTLKHFDLTIDKKVDLEDTTTTDKVKADLLSHMHFQFTLEQIETEVKNGHTFAKQTVTVNGDGEANIDNIPYGKYTISEVKRLYDGEVADPEYYVFQNVTITGDGLTDNEDGTYTLDLTSPAVTGSKLTVDAVNTYKMMRAAVTVTKDFALDDDLSDLVEGKDGNSWRENIEATKEFTFTLTGTGANGQTYNKTVTVTKEKPTATFSDIPLGGVFTLTETNLEMKDYEFVKLEITDKTGRVTAVENTNNQFKVDLTNLTDEGGNKVVAHSTVTVTAVNHIRVKTGTVTIHKDISLDGTTYEGSQLVKEDFKFTLKGTDLNGVPHEYTKQVHYGATAEFTNVPFGNYTITESMDVNDVNIQHYDFRHVTFVKDGVSETPITQEQIEENKEAAKTEIVLNDANAGTDLTLELGVTNEYANQKADLSVQKVISGNSMDYSAKYDFTVALKSPGDYLTLAQSYNYDVVDAQGNPVLDENGEPKRGTIQQLIVEKTLGTMVNGELQNPYTVLGNQTVEVDGEYYTVYGTITGLGNGEKAVVKDLPAGVRWHVVETKENQGYNTNYDHQNGIVTKGADNSVTVTNSHSVYTTVSVQKVWVGDNANRRPTSITVQLVRDGQPVEGETKVLNESNGWHNSWSGLSTGHRYTVIEVSGNSGYTTTVTGEGSGTTVNITVTNTYDERTDNTRLRVNKVWVGDDPFTRPNEVTVQLLKNGQPDGAVVTLSESNGWTYEWTGLDASASYDVEEVAIPAGYTVSKTQDGRTYTITNTYDTTIPDDDIPLTDLPDDDIPLADLPDDDIPLAELPDDEIPLDEAPQTGDNSRKGLWLALAICSAFGMAITGKLLKTKEEDQGDGEN